jgi:hypothetical protein
MRTDILDRKADILAWIENNDSKASIAARLRCKIDTFESYMKKMGIVYKGNMNLKGKQRLNQRVHVEKHLVKGSSLGSHS